MPSTLKIRCVAVDDEPPALQVMEKFIRAVPSLELTGLCNNAGEAFQMIQAQGVDLLFLDIQMPGIYGTDFLRSLMQPPRVIFTTAFRRFAVEGFDLEVVDFLLKPISFERFLKAVKKVTKGAPEPAYLDVRVDRQDIRIPLEEILYIESIRDYVKVVTLQKTFLCKQTIRSLESNLPGSQFLRIHRSFMVSRAKVVSYEGAVLQIGGYALPVSRSYRKLAEAFRNQVP